MIAAAVRAVDVSVVMPPGVRVVGRNAVIQIVVVEVVTAAWTAHSSTEVESDRRQERDDRENSRANHELDVLTQPPGS